VLFFFFALVILLGSGCSRGRFAQSGKALAPLFGYWLLYPADRFLILLLAQAKSEASERRALGMLGKRAREARTWLARTFLQVGGW